jgi:hypothetical protein
MHCGHFSPKASGGGIKIRQKRHSSKLGFTHEVQRGLGIRKYLERCFVSEAFVWSSIEESFDFLSSASVTVESRRDLGMY